MNSLVVFYFLFFFFYKKEELNFEKFSSNVAVEFNSALSRIQKEFLNLISVFFVADRLKSLKKDIENHNSQNLTSSREIQSNFVFIASNIATFCATMMKGSGLRMSLLIFSPNLESLQLHPYSTVNANRFNSKHLQLGLLISFIKYITNNLEKTLELKQDLLSKQKNVNDLMDLEIKQVKTRFRFQFQFNFKMKLTNLLFILYRF
jgi:hypothetical protein